MYRIRLTLAAVLFTALFACGSDDSPREKFIGNWAGTYDCQTRPPADTMFIAKGSGDLDFRITTHATQAAPFVAVVVGRLTDVNIITISESTGFFFFSGQITFSNNTLSLVERAAFFTCRGSNYVKY